MQTVSDEALAEAGVSGYKTAACLACGSEVLEYGERQFGGQGLCCANCRGETIWWAPQTGRSGQDARGVQAVVGPGDESGQLVSQAKGEARCLSDHSQASSSRLPVSSVDQGTLRSRPTVTTASSTDHPGISTSSADSASRRPTSTSPSSRGPERQAYNAFMREYMRNWRARKRKESR